MKDEIFKNQIEHRKTLIAGYTWAGATFLGRRLADIFSLIDTEQQKGVHNDAVKEIGIMVGDNPDFLVDIARTILSKLQTPEIKE